MAYHMTDFAPLDNRQLDSYGNPLPVYSCDGPALGQEYSFLQNILVDGGTHFGVSTVAFDTFEELLWMGNQGGHVTSYASPELQKYTSFQVHASNDIRGIVSHDLGILSLTSDTLRMSARRGLTTFTHSSEQLQDMQCMVLTPTGTLLIGGHHKNLIEFDLNRMEEINIVQVSGDNCAILRKHPRFICSGDISGKVTLHDPATLNVVHVIDSHSGMLSDFDVHGNQLVTCGFSKRHGELTVDRFLKIYDLRAMRSMVPIQLVFPPLLLRFISAYSSRLCVVSQSGEFQMVDTDNSDKYSVFIQQVETAGSHILTFDTSSSCQALAFGDAAGYLHLYGTSDQVQFNQFNRPIEYADSVPTTHSIDINDQLSPLSAIPFPHCSGKLLSDWPPELCQNVYRPTPPIDPQILSTMKMVGSIGYAPNPGNRLRNQVAYQLNGSKSKGSSQETPSRKEDGVETIPQRYLKQEIKYSRMGIEEIDYTRYNRTGFSALEGNLPNSYCNNMIQILYFVEPLRCALLSHLCQREFCLACELGFLFHMLDSVTGLPCQASNFLRAFRTIPEASAHGLVINELEPKKREKLQNLVQNWMRFMLQQLHMETAETYAQMQGDPKALDADSDSVLNRLFGYKLLTNNCCRCRTETCQEMTSLSVRLLYPDCKPSTGNSNIFFTFGEIVQRSLAPKQQTSAWCDTCNRYTSMIQTKFPKTLPDILVLTCGDNKQDMAFWEKQLKMMTESESSSVMKALPEVSLIRKKLCRYGQLCKRTDCRYFHEQKQPSPPNHNNSSWIPFGLKISLKNNDFKVENWSPADEIKLDTENEEEFETVFYELSSIISIIVDDQEAGKDNIVSCIKIGGRTHPRCGNVHSQWYLFNDFTVVPISAEEAVYLNFDWKRPSVLQFSRKDLNSRHSTDVYNPVAQQVFHEDVSLAASSGQSHITFTPLSTEESLVPGQLVAMDAEFVTLNQEEAEIRSDGTRSTIRPSHLSVARISCVRGEGPLEGVPFIDDYISTQEQLFKDMISNANLREYAN